MNHKTTDILIIGAGPVGLLLAYLGQQCGLNTLVLDKSAEPLQVGRADALNARTLQLMEVINAFDELYPQGKPCNTSSVWANGAFVSRQTAWWDVLEGCFHKHFLMLGQSFVEQLLDKRLTQANAGVLRQTAVEAIELKEHGCKTTLTNGDVITSSYIIGADGSQSYVRQRFAVPFEIVRPQIVWAVLDGVLETDFEKVPEIIVFQAETSDVAWIPREGNIDRFYVRMDTNNFTMEEAIEKINRAMHPHTLRFKDMVWYSQFSVKESVAEQFFIQNSVFLAGDACHIHSVNGGQGMNTGLADAFNLMWKLNMVIQHGAPLSLLQSYEDERQPVAMSVIESSGELVRSTKYSETGTHAQDYVKIIEKRAGNITGMGVRYGEAGLNGTRIYDFEIYQGHHTTRLYTLLDYSKFTLLIFGDDETELTVPPYVKVLRIAENSGAELWSTQIYYRDQSILVRPDAYIHALVPSGQAQQLIHQMLSTTFHPVSAKATSITGQNHE
ncbi:FAD-binding protein [Shewanella psychropiezotolerans]|uniref:FAD-binding protein n=1 Tax=Shewanella psychropiezotolerans TaxID=2593655 RepID=A0ABX5WYZ4_9GAMM|nr:FAD-binding protein [Shewanella psychropiezotolerans]QDO84326.1 FAD-binding protein [Shewanella psychropiezotolerans]